MEEAVQDFQTAVFVFEVHQLRKSNKTNYSEFLVSHICSKKQP